MSDPSQRAVCAICGLTLPAGQEECGACGISGAWQELIRALDFARDRFMQWVKGRLIGLEPAEAIGQHFKQQRKDMVELARGQRPVPAATPPFLAERCWSCRGRLGTGQSYCTACGAPIDHPLAQDLRRWIFTCHLIKAHCDAGRLPLAQAHACMNDAKSRIAALRTRLEKDRLRPAVVVAEAVAEPRLAPSAAAAANTTAQAATRQTAAAQTTGQQRRPLVKPSGPRRSFWEILLDPRTIQWLLGLGGGLLVLGLIIWLAALGFFRNAVVVALALGAGNLALLLGGWAIIRFSRYHTAGRAITLLACLVMPLNLWFYHVHGLITLAGHLWAAALVCCVFYFASALLLRDHVFVYVLNGGIALTGLLMLAASGRFWEIASPALLLVILGLMSIHLERAFPAGEGPFSRGRFGMAFFRSGQALLAAGLLLVLGAQIAGDWLYRPLFEPLYDRWNLGPPSIVAERWGQYLALALVLLGAYACFYSDIVVRRLGVYIYLGVFSLLWAEVLALELITLRITSEVVILAFALTALAANLLQVRLFPWRASQSDEQPPAGKPAPGWSLVRAGQPLGLFLSTVPVLLGLVLHLRATLEPLNELWPQPGGERYTVTWLYVIAMLVTAASCRLGAHLYRRTVPWLSATYFFGTAASTLMGLAGLLAVVGVRSWDEMAPLMMLVPIVYVIAARLYRGHTQENPLVWAAQAATGVMVVAVLAAAMHWTPEHVIEPASGQRLNLLLAAFFAEAAVFYALAAAFRQQGVNLYLGTAMACGAVWQLLQYHRVDAEYYTLFFALLGLLLLVCYRLAMLEWTGLVKAAFHCANALMSLSFLAAALITLSRLATQLAALHWSTVFLLLALTLMSLLAAWLVQDAAWRRWYVVMAITEIGLTLLTLNVLSHLSLWDKLEIFSVLIGTALLAIGHAGWYREQEQQSDLVSFSLAAGSLLVGLPLTVAVLIHRGHATPEFSTLNELGMLAAGIILLGSGFAFQLRATTISGASLLLVYLLSLVLYINMLENVQTAAIWMMIGGASIFAAAIFLSIYRDRLLTLPERVHRREGVFRVLSWR